MRCTSRVSNPCLRCGRATEERRILCGDCGRIGSKEILNTGDLPLILLMVIVPLIFVLFHTGNGQPFHVDGLSISGNNWGLLLVSIFGIYVLFDAVKNWRVFRKLEIHRSVAKTICFPMIVVPLVILLFSSFRISVVILSAISILMGIFLLFFSLKRILKVDPWDNLLHILTILLLSVGLLGSFNGHETLGPVGLFPNSIISFLGVPGMVIFTVRSNRNTSISAKSSSIHVLLPLLLLATLISVIAERNGREEDITSYLWFLAIVILIYTIGLSIVKRSMDLKLNSAMRMHSEITDGTKKTTDPSMGYRLNRIDSAIWNNPIHGLGDDPDSGNPLFQMERGPERERFGNKINEYSKAHREKGLLLASRGRFKEALREYGKALTKDPDDHRTYYSIAQIRSVLYGEKGSIKKDLDMFFASKRIMIYRLMEGMPADDYIYVFGDLFERYVRSVEEKIEIMARNKDNTDIGSYFTLSREK